MDKNFIWTTLKGGFLSVYFFCTLRLQILKCYNFRIFIQMMHKSKFQKVDTSEWFRGLCKQTTQSKAWIRAQVGLNAPCIIYSTGFEGDYITRILFPDIFRQLLRKNAFMWMQIQGMRTQCDTDCATDRWSDFPRMATNSVTLRSGCVASTRYNRASNITRNLLEFRYLVTQSTRKT